MYYWVFYLSLLTFGPIAAYVMYIVFVVVLSYIVCWGFIECSASRVSLFLLLFFCVDLVAVDCQAFLLNVNISFQYLCMTIAVLTAAVYRRLIRIYVNGPLQNLVINLF